MQEIEARSRREADFPSLLLEDLFVLVAHQITARKHEGDDSAWWAILRDGDPVIAGLTKSEVPSDSRLVALALVEREAR